MTTATDEPLTARQQKQILDGAMDDTLKRLRLEAGEGCMMEYGAVELDPPREVWRAPGDATAPSGSYSPWVACHDDGRVRMCVGGTVVTMLIREWMDLAISALMASPGGD